MKSLKLIVCLAAITAFAACTKPEKQTEIGFATDTLTVSAQLNTEFTYSVEVNVSNPVGETTFTHDVLPAWITLTSKGTKATFTGTPTELENFNVTLTATNNGESATQEILIVVTTAPVPRTLLIEEFTSETCSYCPNGAEAIHAAIVGNENNVVIVCHHVGYNEDRYTIAKSRPLTAFYGGGIYAPACMIDRRTIPEVDDDVASPVFFPGYLPKPIITKSVISKQLAVPSYVTVNLNTTYNDVTGELNVDVSGFLGSYSPNAKVNVYIIQEGIIGPQSGGGQNYLHKHVLRAALSANFGDVLDVTTGNYQKTYTFIIPATISGVQNIAIPTDPANMYVVAFIADYINNIKDNVLNKSQVHNAVMKKIIEP